jgi:hypothetical protein
MRGTDTDVRIILVFKRALEKSASNSVKGLNWLMLHSVQRFFMSMVVDVRNQS